MLFKESRATHQKWTSSQLVFINYSVSRLLVCLNATLNVYASDPYYLRPRLAIFG